MIYWLIDIYISKKQTQLQLQLNNTIAYQIPIFCMDGIVKNLMPTVHLAEYNLNYYNIVMA